ncbi:glucokinase [Nannochloropsis gaditana]|uniref:Glucokinase n=1 Tax=Nannochloropsis gaditana TaxID=72520 RepID=W7U8G2_9STRA|nr:glucokinase [Nannochloropsis gaditana]
MTNRGRWIINGDRLAKEVGLKRVVLINDFVAQGYGLLTVDRTDTKEVHVLQDASPEPGAPIATIGAGTGLGECFLTPGEDGYYVAYPSEGGHAEFPPRTETEFQLLEFLKRRYEQKHRVSVERVVSGPGIANVYDFLAEHYPDQVDKSVDAAFRAAGEMGGKIVSENAKPGTLAGLALDIFAGAYGSEAGVAGLKWMPFGGLFITGGLTPKNIDRIAGENSLFMEAFRDKGRVSPLLSKIPMYAVLVEDLGERGAHWMAIKTLLEHLNHGNVLRGVFKGAATGSASRAHDGISFWRSQTAVTLVGGVALASLSFLAAKFFRK